MSPPSIWRQGTRNILHLHSRTDRRSDPQGAPPDICIHIRRDLQLVPGQHLRQSTHRVHDLETSEDVALGVGESLALFENDGLGEVVVVFTDESLVPVEIVSERRGATSRLDQRRKREKEAEIRIEGGQGDYPDQLSSSYAFLSPHLSDSLEQDPLPTQQARQLPTLERFLRLVHRLGQERAGRLRDAGEDLLGGLLSVSSITIRIIVIRIRNTELRGPV